MWNFLVPVKLITYPGPGALADDIANLDIGNIANETERAKTIEFSPAYCNIQVRHSHRRTKIRTNQYLTCRPRTW